MSISFKVESDRVGTEDATVKLFKRVSSDAPVQIRQEIALCYDDLDESGQFQLGGWDWHKSVCQHLVGNLLPVPEDAESLVAWYATVGLGSFELQASKTGSEILDAVKRQKSMDLTAQSILETLGMAKAEWATTFLSLSYGAIECFLLGELHNNPSKMGSVRERIKEQATNYLKQLRFRSDVVETVQNEIDGLDCEFLKEFESAGEERSFPHTWCNYFRTLDASDLSLFNPNKPVSARRAYATIRAWYQTHKGELSRLGQRRDYYVDRSIELIDALPSANKVTVLEMRAVFREVIMGLLERAFGDSDGVYIMSHYAKVGLQAEGVSFQLSEDELKKLMGSWIGPYITGR